MPSEPPGLRSLDCCWCCEHGEFDHSQSGLSWIHCCEHPEAKGHMGAGTRYLQEVCDDYE